MAKRSILILLLVFFFSQVELTMGAKSRNGSSSKVETQIDKLKDTLNSQKGKTIIAKAEKKTGKFKNSF